MYGRTAGRTDGRTDIGIRLFTYVTCVTVYVAILRNKCYKYISRGVGPTPRPRPQRPHRCRYPKCQMHIRLGTTWGLRRSPSRFATYAVFKPQDIA